MNSILDNLISINNNSVEGQEKINRCRICGGYFNYFNLSNIFTNKNLKKNILLMIYLKILFKINELQENIENITNSKIIICKSCYNQIIRELKEQKNN